ncbi:autoinducer 2 sensor kinase/phosphatase luxQ [Didymella exigua CBS 183.55]|uniref:Autoinducer 2 sensor kinase/phosphatase luxQ n=1 Tax=Didymella exigua CBS 183.55 TaxID=1150837 RepID=A0A6A5RDD4_9PLEO|nr:autoinducer 2 sensor kinase/phosphatase luxQ [Didymella exigua CBS 183.55]KAF1926275.1 autoinducer 2 sensor kinase/phosphatase luxQ [Didymella exigua CBS 183.55]
MGSHAAEHDWTEDLPQTDHVRFFRDTDWSKSKLGPVGTWSSTLRLLTGFVLADSRAACLWWGPDLVAIYNERYAPLACKAHPKLMGSTLQQGYPELWTEIKPFFERCRKTAAGVDYSSEASLLIERKGWREETFFSGNFVPVGPAYAPEGFYNSLFEVTQQKLDDRRTMLLNALTVVPSMTVDSVFDHVLATLKTNANDVPMALLYRIHDDTKASILSLEGQIGIPEGHSLLADNILIEDEEGLAPDLLSAGVEILAIDCDKRFDGVDWQGWHECAKKIIILPLTNGVRLFGYLVVGTNPYRPYPDMHCEQFHRDLKRMVSSLISSAFHSESSKRRQEQLEADLAFSDLKLRHLINHASVGMCHVSLEGDMLWANDHYYELAGNNAAQHTGPFAFLDACYDSDQYKAVGIWEELLAGEDHVTAELRMKRQYKPPLGEPEPAHIHIMAFPYRENGATKSIMACTTDISRLKWAQSFQARLAAEAREAKRQQEAFIDVVSHEMRNPLGAIVHCADAITSVIEECQARLTNIPGPCLDALNDNIASANIILQCANHQKRIIDDVLTLSKLDSMLLSITPTPVKPAKLVTSIVNIFEAELKSNKIDYSIFDDQSLARLNIDHLLLDPSRVTQVFINLLTNAIKFVKPSSSPRIEVHFGACLHSPRSLFPPDMFWATTSNLDNSVTSSPEWGNGEEVYLAFSVKDTGIGLKNKEIRNIFERFKQANVKTHIKYGGSGLGLFISNDLTEKQGGEIGVSSVLGEGSTFGFYVKTRRAERRPQTMGEMDSEFGAKKRTQQALQVLLVEDNLINQKVLSKQLKKAGCVVSVANHGLEALGALEKDKFDVVLMDLEMPVLDGLAAMRKIREKENTEEGLLGEAMKLDARGGDRLPIIAVTANVRKEQIDTAMEAGADRVMQKPFKAADLVYMMKSLLPQVTTPKIDSPTPDWTKKGDGLIP